MTMNVMSSIGAWTKSGYKYSKLPVQPESSKAQSHNGEWSPQSWRRFKKFSLVGLVLAIAIWILVITKQSLKCRHCSGGPYRQWGQYTPYFPVESELELDVPAGCELTFVQVLSRHGARAPTADKTREYNETVAKIHSSTIKYAKHYEFIKDYKYQLGADDLTPFGQRMMVKSGREAFERYGRLAVSSEPFIRASGQQRVVESAMNWTQGFFGLAAAAGKNILVLPENIGFNNTLSHGLCTAFETGEASLVGQDAQRMWLDKFARPIRRRLSKRLRGTELSHHETIHLMELCPFETVADPLGKTSKFCGLFGEHDWRGFEYYQTLGKFYGYGNGNPLGPTQGVGWVNELVARLTERPVEDRTSTNSTLDGNEITFPLGRSFYADFSHDNDMMAIYAALGLYNATGGKLPLKHRTGPGHTAGFSASWTVPFAARMYVEKMTCDNARDDKDKKEELVRVIVNHRVIPLQGCGADDLGRCRLSKFVQSLSFAEGAGRWSQCF